MDKKVTQKCSKGNTNTFSRHRWWPSFTSFLETPPHYDEDCMKYLCYGLEICPKTGKKHYQGCVYFYDAKTISTAQKKLHIGKSHMEWEQKSDTEDDPIEYCKKDKCFFEFGSMPQQGKRTDLEAVAKSILDGTLRVTDILEQSPIMYHQYGRTLTALEDLKLTRKWRTEMTEGIWMYGTTGVGKSHIAFQDYHPDTHYLVPDDNGWWDKYTQQDTVIINDFRGHIKYDKLLQMVDKFPFDVNRRGKPPMPFLSKKVIITSSLKPSEVYCNRQEKDDIKQLERRFKIVELTTLS